MKINKPNLQLFYFFISERHNINKKKSILKLAPPWTDNPILKEFKFTNVFRDLDPGTRFVIDELTPGVSTVENLIFNIIIYRLYNKIQTSRYLWIQDVRNFSRNSFEKKLREIKDSWEKVFTNAFIVSGYGFVSSEWDKVARTSRIIDDISKVIPELTNRIEENKSSGFTFETIKSLPWIWDFLAYQICVDIGYARQDSYNEDVHVVAGPGCRRWLDRIWEDRGELSYEQCIAWLVDNQDVEFKKLWIDMWVLFDDREVKRLNLMAVENCLCEFSKYMKALNWEGRPRNRYRVI
ncbi:MAG: hypothetical protein ACD_3C00192G0006 [uncultured bacterium (gcode 4)]|uniref:5-hmdU DNA kinase helical domain-containing protein n=1 Tax=uncultured bacterium (gcode 4) TaxID=1234023 RepID=K2F8V1_9BACT|nr:MAG: hypothetical protein ACD_3C00192G0006 [uncultured bacterium (gcode 4)]